jgi:hypothetical protein
MLIDFLNEFSDAQAVTATAVGSKTVNGVKTGNAKLSELYAHFRKTTELSILNTLTMDTQPTAGDTMTIGDTTYTYTTDGTAATAGEIDVGADLADCQGLTVAAINGTGAAFNVANGEVTAAAFATNASVLTAVAGLDGSDIATTETFTAATNLFSAATMGTGTVTFTLQTSATGSATALTGTTYDLAVSGAITIAAINAAEKSEAWKIRVPEGALKYLGIKYTVSTTLGTGAFDAFLNADAN